MPLRASRKPAIATAIIGLLSLLFSSVPRAESPSIDVLGVRLGMPLDEAIEQLKTRHPEMQVGKSEQRFTVARRSTPFRVNGSLMAPGKTGGRYLRESVVLEAVPGPEPSVVTAIHRLTQYSDAPLAFKTAVEAIKQKYGEPADELASGTNSVTFTWVYDPAGVPIKPAMRLPCSGVPAVQGVGAPKALARSIQDPSNDELQAQQCGAFLSINFTRDGDVVTGMATYAVDMRARVARLKAMQGIVKQAKAEANRQSAQDAATRGGPDL